MTRARRILACAAAVLAATFALAGCTSTVSLAPADDANNPHCADVMVRLPDAVSTADRVWTDAQATASWGGPPSSVILACGVAVPGPTVLPCVAFQGVDWIVADGKNHVATVTTFGRKPAIQVMVDTSKVDFNAVLNSISIAVNGGRLPTTGDQCTAPATPSK
ncbi:DUF3515 family protein [Microbacterium sp. ASV49]|uniref:DUF3515 family protein n=1 Tax=Microbacterium candidum TaxID=3041922 RepID=A0ABT7MZY4_9MICO|nr:DUF3515 family protein [Microbacterium sp. ASV49]MDL9980019.1 DUF3515 family protein [Microbacterium sp. ASV49]